jgi:hypothetical protein
MEGEGEEYCSLRDRAVMVYRVRVRIRVRVSIRVGVSVRIIFSVRVMSLLGLQNSIRVL